MTRNAIVIIDDECDTRDALSALLSVDFDVRSFESASAFLAALDRTDPPDCVLLDLRMPGMDGSDLQSELTRRDFRAPVILMSGDAEKADIITAWRKGAEDFILKPFSGDEILQLIGNVLNRSAKATPETSNPCNDRDIPITRREAQVLSLLGQGYQQHEIAQSLGIALRTVKMYRCFLKNKLNLGSLVEVGRFYDRHMDSINHLTRK